MQVLDKPVEVKVQPSEADLFCQAADLLEGGWIKGKSQDGLGNYCAAGAIFHVVERHFRGEPYLGGSVYANMTKRLMGVIQLMYPEFKDTVIPLFNDAPGTTKEMVLEVVRKAGDCA